MLPLRVCVCVCVCVCAHAGSPRAVGTPALRGGVPGRALLSPSCLKIHALTQVLTYCCFLSDSNLVISSLSLLISFSS